MQTDVAAGVKAWSSDDDDTNFDLWSWISQRRDQFVFILKYREWVMKAQSYSIFKLTIRRVYWQESGNVICITIQGQRCDLLQY